MNSGDFRVTALLTEHLGFAPLTLVDEVINAVNKIMYNCTDALQAFLLKRREAQLQTIRNRNGIGAGDADVMADGLMDDQIAAAEKNGEVFPEEEIHHGTSELETLLVSHVDKNFDKFELYTLRNIFTMPRDLVEGGWIRLKHHEHLDELEFTEVDDGSDERIKTLLKNISMELELRKILELQLAKSKKLVGLLTRYKHSVNAFMLTHLDSELSPESVRMLKESLTPMNENVYYLLRQLKELINQVIRLNQLLEKSNSLETSNNLHFRPSSRDNYIQEKTLKTLDCLNTYHPDSRPAVG